MRTPITPGRARRAVIAATLAATLAAMLLAAPGAGAFQTNPAPVPCTPGSGARAYCTFYPAGDGISAGAPVVNSAGTRVGYLNHGSNFVLCEAWGDRVGTSSTYNHWWAWTEANDGAYGWVSAYYAQGGDNDGGFQGVADCAGAHGEPPGGSAQSPSNSAQVPCAAIGAGRYDCYFYPAGNGRSGGAPVRSSSGALVGYLNQGENYVLCEAKGEEVGTTTVYNNTWAYTVADNGHHGWVNAYYARGGVNNGDFQNVPQCSSAQGYPPGGAPSPSPKPSPPSPKAVSCHRTAASQYTCSFYPAGDGFSGGAPVQGANQQGVGYLNHGSNWITCQQVGGEVSVGSDHNRWWGRTEADNGSWGWVNAVYASTGDNDGAYGGVPNCNGADGATPQGPVVAPPGGGGGGGGAPPTNPPGSGNAPNEIPPVYVPMYKASGGQYGVNWLLIASIHAQETNFSRSTLPGVRNGLNNAGCCAGPTQFSVISGADTWASYKDAFAPISGDRPARYPLQSGVTVCGSGGGHPCVYDDFDAISATGSYLHADGASQSLSSPATYTAVRNYGDSSDYADSVIGRAERWQNGMGGSSHFANVLFQDAAIKVTSERATSVAARAATARTGKTGKRHKRHRVTQPKLRVLVSYHSTIRAARRAFRRFIRAYHYAQPGATYTVHYKHVKARHKHHKRHKHKKK